MDHARVEEDAGGYESSADGGSLERLGEEGKENESWGEEPGTETTVPEASPEAFEAVGKD